MISGGLSRLHRAHRTCWLAMLFLLSAGHLSEELRAGRALPRQRRDAADGKGRDLGQQLAQLLGALLIEAQMRAAGDPGDLGKALRRARVVALLEHEDREAELAQRRGLQARA